MHYSSEPHTCTRACSAHNASTRLAHTHAHMHGRAEWAGVSRLEEQLATLNAIIQEERAARQGLERRLEALDASLSPSKVGPSQVSV